MIIKKIKTSLFAFAIISIVGLNAQNLNVFEKKGNLTPISIHNIKTLSFLPGSIKINLKVGTPLSFSLNSVRNIHFTPTTDIESPSIKTFDKIHLFPNPAKEYLNIVLNSNNSSEVDLKIISLEGRIIYTQKLNRRENNQHTINISTWANGLYYLFINDGKTVSSNKFLKTN